MGHKMEGAMFGDERLSVCNVAVGSGTKHYDKRPQSASVFLTRPDSLASAACDACLPCVFVRARACVRACVCVCVLVYEWEWGVGS